MVAAEPSAKYDSLSKANFFLETQLSLVDEDLDSRLVNFLMQAPENDGGRCYGYSLVAP